MNSKKLLLVLFAAVTIGWVQARAVDTRTLELTMNIAGKPYQVTAEPFANCVTLNYNAGLCPTPRQTPLRHKEVF